MTGHSHLFGVETSLTRIAGDEIDDEVLTGRRIVQQRHHVADVARALLRILLETPLQQSMCLWGDFVEVRFVSQDAGDRFPRRLALVRRHPGQHLVEHAAERPDVGPPVHDLTRGLLGRHVARCAQDDARLGLRQGNGCRFCCVCEPAGPSLGETEIQHLDDAVRTNLDVARLEVAMDDAALMRIIERVHDLSGDL